MSTPYRLFLWRDVAALSGGHTSGIAFAYARSAEEAATLVAERFRFDLLTRFTDRVNGMLTPREEKDLAELRAELRAEPPEEIDGPFGHFEWGSA